MPRASVLGQATVSAGMASTAWPAASLPATALDQPHQGFGQRDLRPVGACEHQLVAGEVTAGL